MPTEIKKMICDYVFAVQGCKVTQLVANEEIVLSCQATGLSLPKLVEELIESGELLEVEYTVPNLGFRAKSFLLPRGSEITRIKCGISTYL